MKQAQAFITVITIAAAAMLASCSGCGAGTETPVPDVTTDTTDVVDTAGDMDAPPDTPADGEDAGDSVGDTPDDTGDAPTDTAAEDEPDPFYTDDDGDGFSEWEGDCDDTNDEIYPGATTHIEGIDYDCDTRREFLAKMLVAVDDAFELCVNGVDVATCTSSSAACFMTSTYHEQILESGLNVVGVHGWDVVGVTASFAMWIEAAGTEIVTRGNRSTEPDTALWRYFPTTSESPQATWCHQSYDDSGWGPSMFAGEVGDHSWFHHPADQIKLGSTWLWDGNPPGLSDSWFRIKLYLPDVDPDWDPPSTPTCAIGTPHLVSNPTTTTAKRTDNGCDVIWNGFNWVAVYDEWVRPWSWSSPEGGCDDVHTRLLAPDGSPTGLGVNINDQGSSTATNALWWNMWPAVAWTGSSIGVFFEDCRTNRTHDYLYGHITGITGSTTTSDVRLDTGSTRQKYPTAAWSGSEFGVAWQDERDGGFEIYFKRLDADLSPIGSAVRITNAAGTSRVPAMVWTGSEFGLVWEDNRDAGDHEIYFARISSTGTKIGSDVRLTSSPGQSLDPEIAWTGSEFGLVWHDDGWVNMEIGFMTIDPTATVATPPVRVTQDSSVSEGADIVWNGSAFGLAWRDNRTGNGDIYFALLSPDGTKLAGDDQVTGTAGLSIHPAIAWSGSAFGIAWKEEEDPAVVTSTPWNLDTWFATVTCP